MSATRAAKVAMLSNVMILVLYTPDCQDEGTNDSVVSMQIAY